jgi:hypothetical protein
MKVNQEDGRNRTVGAAVTLVAYIREMLGSNTGRNIDYPEILCGFTKFLQATPGMVPRLGNDRLLTNHFQIIINQSSYHATP